MGRKADSSAGLLHGEVRKPTVPQDFSPAKRESRLLHRTFASEAQKPTRPPDFFTAKCESRQRRRTLPRRSAKADCATGLCPGEVRKPTVPQDFPSAKRESRQRRRTLPRRSAKADCAAGLCPGEARKPTAPRDFPSAKCESRQRRRTFLRRSAKADDATGLCPGEVRKPTRPLGLLHGEAQKSTAAVVFPRARLLGAPAAPAAGKTARFLIAREKASFYETATFRRRKVSFCSPFCGLLFCPGRAKLALPAGKSPPPRTPRRPCGGPPQRLRPAPGFCAASANARPGDSAPVRLLEKALWVPPTTEPFRPAPSGKPERERKTKGGNPMPRPPPV